MLSDIKLYNLFCHNLKILSKIHTPYIYTHKYVYVSIQTKKIKREWDGGQHVYMYCTYYLSLNTHLKVAAIFHMALKVSSLIVHPFVGL